MLMEHCAKKFRMHCRGTLDCWKKPKCLRFVVELTISYVERACGAFVKTLPTS